MRSYIHGLAVSWMLRSKSLSDSCDITKLRKLVVVTPMLDVQMFGGVELSNQDIKDKEEIQEEQQA